MIEVTGFNFSTNILGLLFGEELPVYPRGISTWDIETEKAYTVEGEEEVKFWEEEIVFPRSQKPKKQVQATLKNLEYKGKKPVFRDKRSEAAYDFYNKYEKGIIVVYKTTRAGATTSIIAESLSRNERALILEPTRKIGMETVCRGAVQYSRVKDPEIVMAHSNHDCMYNIELIGKYPELARLPFLPLPETCKDCKHFDVCEVTGILRNPTANGYVLTYHKLAALMMAARRENSTAQEILDILKTCKNIILDEVHELDNLGNESLMVYDGRRGESWNLNIYESLPDKKFKWIKEIVKRMRIIKDDSDIQIMIHEVKGGAEEADSWKQHLNKRRFNPVMEVVQNQNEAVIAGAIKEAIELTKVRKDYGVEIEDILQVFKMVNLVTSSVIAVNALKEKGIPKVLLTCVDRNSFNSVRSFVMSMQTKADRIILTSATISEFESMNLFMGRVKPINAVFGEGGDPLNTNEKMLIIADNKKYNAVGDRSRYKMRAEITSRILTILEAYEGQEVMIVTLSKKESAVIEKALEQAGSPHKVLYYKSPELMGVSCSARIMIAVGIANKPSNAKDAYTLDELESKKRLWSEVHSDTYQAISRVKDPNGKDPSIVFGLGCCYDDLKACIEWGINRKITGIKENRNGCRNKVNVEVEEDIAKPQILLCKNFEEMLAHAGNHRQLSKELLQNKNNRLCNIIDGFSHFSAKVLTVNAEFLEEIINRRDAILIQSKDGRYEKRKIPITALDIKLHLKGEKTIGGYHLDTNSFVKWICFDVDAHPKPEHSKDQIKELYQEAERKKDQLLDILSKLKIPYRLEKSGSPHSYHFWIFLKPVHASSAYDFAHDIRKELGWKEKDVEIFPKQKQIDKKGYGNFVKLPLGISQKHGGKSEIMQDGEFVRKISNLEIQYIDITGYKAYVDEEKVKAQKARKAQEPVFNNKVNVGDYQVRDCILRASQMVLHKQGAAGNSARVFIVREFLCAGMQPEEILEIFKQQPDYVEETTRYHIGQIMKKDLPPVPCSTIYENVGSLIGCDSCSNFWRCEC